MKPDKFKRLMRAQGHWRNRADSVAEPQTYTRDEPGQVELCMPAKVFWVDGSPLMESNIKNIPIMITSLNRDIFVRVTKGKEKLNDFMPIYHTSESASLKAFNMEEGGARHLFSVFDGLTYPMQSIEGYYHFVSNEIYQAKSWVNGKESTGVIKIESAPFPGHFGKIAAREEYRNISEFTITNEDVLSIPIFKIQAMYHELFNNREKEIKIAYHNERTHRKVVFILDFKNVFKDILITGRFSEMLLKDEILSFLQELPSK